MWSKTSHTVVGACGGLLGGFLLAVSIRAQTSTPVATPGVAQQVLLNAPLAQFPGKQVTVFTGEFAPGARTPLHRHPATELLFVLEGEGVMNIPGRKSHELTPGRVVLVEPGAGKDSFIHEAVNLSESDRMKTLVIVIHDQGTPPALPLNDQDQ
jgi:quercetin dioxygenase-like cupin family protein